MYWYDSAGKKHTNDEYTIADISENMIEVFGEPKDEVKIILKAGEIECVWRFLLSAEDIEVRLAVCGDNVEVGRICPLCSEELKVDSFNAQDQKSEMIYEFWPFRSTTISGIDLNLCRIPRAKRVTA